MRNELKFSKVYLEYFVKTLKARNFYCQENDKSFEWENSWSIKTVWKFQCLGMFYIGSLFERVNGFREKCIGQCIKHIILID